MAPSLPFDKLNESNYDDWKLQMEAHLVEKELFGIINGTEELPTAGPNSKAMRTYLQKQRLARAKIILAVEPSQLPHVRDENPAIIWDRLSKIHSARGLGTLLTMRRTFFTMSMPIDTSIATWVAQVRHAAYRLNECYRLEHADQTKNETDFFSSTSSHVTDLDKVMVLTSGLPLTYTSLLVYISTIPITALNFEDVVTQLLNEEQRQKSQFPSAKLDNTLTSDLEPGTAMLASSSSTTRTFKKPSIKCHRCGGVGHFRNQCPTRDSDAMPGVNAVIENEGNFAGSATPISSDEDESF
jgi:hypothetical protein